MKMKVAVGFATLAVFLLLTSCGQKPSVSSSSVEVIRLFDIFEPDDLQGKVTLENAGIEPTMWSASEITTWQIGEDVPSLGIRAMHDLEPMAISGNAWTGKAVGEVPVLHFALGRNRAGQGPIQVIEVRMEISGASGIWLRPQGVAEVQDDRILDWAGRTNWNVQAEVSGEAMQTYRFELASGGGGPGGRPPGGGPPPRGPRPPAPPPGGRPPGGPPPDRDNQSADGAGDLRHFFLTFRDGKDATFSIESVRLVTEREEKLKEASGQQWAGLAEIYRESLAVKSSETLSVPLRELPARPWLDLAIGTPENDPVTFTVSVSRRGESAEESRRMLLRQTVTTPQRWYPLRIDLAEFAGQGVIMELALTGEKKGVWGYWGTPVVRNRGTETPDDSGKGKPRGVIYLVADTLRPDHLNLHGYERQTTVHLKKFAEEGVAFNHAIAQGTWTKVSQPSMITSLYPLTHGVLGFQESLPASAETIAEVYRDAGYATLCYSSVPFTGKMNNMHQGYEELHESNSVSDPEYNSKTARHYIDRLIPWLERHRDVPFFVYLHVFDPHSPFRPRPPYDTMWGKPEDKARMADIDDQVREKEVKNIFGLPAKEDYVAKTGNDPDELLRIYTDWYDGSIRGMDTEIGRLLEALDGLGLDEDTLIVFASDHGEELWEHGRFFHGHSVYSELSHVPLIFRWPNHPGLKKGTMVDHVVENVDIMPTLLELSGLEGPSRMQGRSLLPLLDGSGTSTWVPRLAVTHTKVDDNDLGGEKGEHFGFVKDGMKVVRKELEPDVVEELYDQAADPLDLHNLIESPGQRTKAEALTQSFEAWRSQTKETQLPSDDQIAQNLSSDELRRLQALGYVGGGVQANDSDGGATDDKDSGN